MKLLSLVLLPHAAGAFRAAPIKSALVRTHAAPRLGMSADDSALFEQPDEGKDGESPAVPSMAQTYYKGPLEAKSPGAGKPLSAEDLEGVKKELAEVLQKTGMTEPTRGFMDTDGIKWRFGHAPDYSLANLLFLKGRSVAHPEGSLEQVVENLVKTWEMERSHKTDPTQHESVDQEKFRLSANGGPVFDNTEANRIGNYNALMQTVPKDLYDANMSWEESHETFEKTFAAFPFEVMEVFSGPPKVALSWRHWGEFTGSYKGNEGKGEMVEMFGFMTAGVNEKLQLQEVEVFYDVQEFLNVLQGDKAVEDANANWKADHGCPFGKMMGKS